MMNQSLSFSSNFAQRLEKLQSYCQWMSRGIAILGFIGLIFGIAKQLFGDGISFNLISINFYTTINLIIAGLTLGFCPSKKPLKSTLKIGGFLIIFITGLSLSYDLASLLLTKVKPYPNALETMPINVAFVFLIIGVTFLLLNQTYPPNLLIEILISGAGFITYIGLLTHIYNKVYFNQEFTLEIGWVTAIPLLVLCTSLLSTRPHQAWIKILMEDYRGLHWKSSRPSTITCGVFITSNFSRVRTMGYQKPYLW